MQLELPRTGLNGSALVELLAQLALTDRPKAPPSFVEGLGRWLGWKEAIHLSAVLAMPVPVPVSAAGASSPRLLAGTPRSAGAASPSSPTRGAGAVARLDAEFTRVRAALALGINEALDEAAADAGEGAGAGSGEGRRDFLPWRRCCFRLQQAMEAAVGPLRTTAQAVLQAQAAQHPGLATLAALDATLAAALAPREQAQLALLPVLLEKLFLRPDAAPDAFRQDMQRLLQAELELRLQPALGLLDALRAAHTPCP